MPSLEEKKYASLKGAEQGYVPKGKEFRQEIRHLKKLKRGDALSTRQAHRLHYLKELRSRRATIGTAKTIGEILATYFTAGGYQAASGAVKAGIKVSKEIAKKAAKKLAKRAVFTAASKGATAIAQSKMKKQMGEASSRAARAEAFGDYGGAQDIRRAGAHYTPGLKAAIPLATSAAMAGVSKFGGAQDLKHIPSDEWPDPDQPSMTGLDEIISDPIPGEDYSYYMPEAEPTPSPVSDPTSFPGAKDWLELQRDKFDARRKGIDPTEFIEEPGFEFYENQPPERSDLWEQIGDPDEFDVYNQLDYKSLQLPDDTPAPSLFAPTYMPPSPLDVESYEEYNLPREQVDPLETIELRPLQQIPSDITAPGLATIQKLPTRKPTRSTLEELTRTEYEDIVDKIEAGPTAATTAASVSDEDLLSMENASGRGTYQDMFDQYKENTDLTDEEIMENVRRSATLSGEFGVDIDSVDSRDTYEELGES